MLLKINSQRVEYQFGCVYLDLYIGEMQSEFIHRISRQHDDSGFICQFSILTDL